MIANGGNRSAITSTLPRSPSKHYLNVVASYGGMKRTGRIPRALDASWLHPAGAFFQVRQVQPMLREMDR